MAKNKDITEAKQRSDLTKFCAFWGITLAALMFVVSGILQIIDSLLNLQSNEMYYCITALDFISKLALLVAVGIPAYGYVRKKKSGWKITYIIAIIFYAGFCVYRLF